MSIDPHEVRMAAGEGAACILDALDDDTVTVIEPTVETLTNTVETLKRNGLPPRVVANLLIGMVLVSVYGKE